MTAEDLLNAYRDEMAPTLGLAFIEGFIARNRNSMLRMLAPLVALMNERMQAPRVSAPRREEDPDEVTPEKDAIVWAAFRSLVNEKRRAFGMQELDEVTESMPFFGRREPDRKEIVEFIQEIKETRKSDWRLAEVLAMHFEFPEAKIVKWLNDHNICPGATTRTMASKCDPSRYKAPKKAEGWLSRKLSGRPKREDLLKVIRELKRERRGDWMLAPTLAGSFGVPDATIVEWLKFHDICPRATARSMASQCVIEDVESLPRRRTCNTRALRDAEDRGRNAVYGANIADAGLTAAWRGMTESLPSRTPIAITLRHPKRRDLVAMVTASASEPGRYQLTWADNDGPSGHTTRDTPEAAVRHAIEEGYRLDTANSAEAREMVERVQQERERRAAEIESWLTESLPSRKASSPRTAQQFIASFMRWEPHDHLYYELLELRPDATTREIDAKWGHSLKLTDSLNPRRPMYRDSSVTRQAYDVLTNPGWRRDYDANGNLDASFQGLRQRALDATLTVASGDAMTDQDREILLGVAEMGPEAYALHRNLRLPEVVAKTREILHEMDADDAKYRLPHKTESLPSPKHAGRMGDGFKVGEHVIRIGDMMKMEGQLGGYVENVDRSKGIARIEQDNGEIKTWPLASLLHDTKANRERQQEHNDQINAEAQARLELSLADWRAR